MHLFVLTLSLFMADGTNLTERFSDVQIDASFRPYLASNLLLMEVAGAKVIRLPEGGTVVLSVASTIMKDDSAKDRLRAERVCRTKALANVVAERKGVQVAHMETLKEESWIVIDDTGESGTSVSELLQITTTKVEGIARDMPVVGRWKSKDGDVFYLAIGAIVGKDGEVVTGNP